MFTHLQTHIGVRLSVFYCSIPYVLSVPLFFESRSLIWEFGDMHVMVLTSMVGEIDHHFIYGEISY
jgi:hypothetical protein